MTCESLNCAPDTAESASASRLQCHKPAWWVLSSGKPTARPGGWRGWKRREWATRVSGLTWRALLLSWLPGYEPDSLISYAREYRANRGAQRAAAAAWKTSAGFGEPCGESLHSCGLESFSSKTSPVFGVPVASLQSSVTLHGSGTMRNGIVSQRRKSVPITRETDFGFWPTPTASDHFGAGHCGQGGLNLRTATLQTPTASDALGSRTTKGSKRQNEGGLRRQSLPTPTTSMVAASDLADAQQSFTARKAARVPTPRAEDGQATGGHRGKADTLPSFVATPQAQDWKSGTGFTPDGRHTPQLRHSAGGMLNPTWVSWLMGVPLGWDGLPLMSPNALSACMPSAMASYLSKQRMLLRSLVEGRD